MKQLSFYDFMNILDQFTIENKELDFRELTVHCNRVMNNDIFLIKDKYNHVITSFALKKEGE